MMRLIAIFFALLLLPTAAFANTYACTPDSFTLIEEGGNLRLTGSIETPTPNYTYAISKETDGVYKLTLTAPEGMNIMVIGKLDIEHAFPAADVENGLTLNIDKSFNWGDNSITCRRVE